MREIKFRAWDKLHKKMVEVSCMALFPNGKVNIYLDGKQRIMDLDNTLFSHDLELMQYTGLKDENGKEIYEGDVVLDEDKERCVVEWNVNGHWHTKRLSGGIYHFNYWKCEVIGNIYENPELCKN